MDNTRDGFTAVKTPFETVELQSVSLRDGTSLLVGIGSQDQVALYRVNEGRLAEVAVAEFKPVEWQTRFPIGGEQS